MPFPVFRRLLQPFKNRLFGIALALCVGSLSPLALAQQNPSLEAAAPTISEAEALVAEGRAFAEMGSLQAAIANYELVDRQFGASEDPEIQQCVATALAQKASALHAQDKPDQALLALDEVVRRFGAATHPALREQVANALLQKGILWEQLEDHAQAMTAYAAIEARFGTEKEPPATRKTVAAALLLRAQLAYQRGQHEEAFALFDRLEQRFKNDDAPMFRAYRAQALYHRGAALENMEYLPTAFETYTRLDALFGNDPDPDVRKWVVAAETRKGSLLRMEKRYAEAVALCDRIDRRFGQDEHSEIQTAVAVALLNKSALQNEYLNNPAASAQVIEQVLKRFCAAPSDDAERQKICRRALSNSVEPMLLLGQRKAALARIQELRRQLPEGDSRLAVMAFLSWLIEPETGTAETVMTAIRAISPDEPVFWMFNSMRPLMERQPKPRKAQAQCFTAFFEDHRSAKMLEGCLNNISE